MDAQPKIGGVGCFKGVLQIPYFLLMHYAISQGKGNLLFLFYFILFYFFIIFFFLIHGSNN